MGVNAIEIRKLIELWPHTHSPDVLSTYWIDYCHRCQIERFLEQSAPVSNAPPNAGIPPGGWPRVGDWVHCRGHALGRVYQITHFDEDGCANGAGGESCDMEDLEPASLSSGKYMPLALEGKHWDRAIAAIEDKREDDDYYRCILDLRAALREVETFINA